MTSGGQTSSLPMPASTKVRASTAASYVSHPCDTEAPSGKPCRRSEQLLMMHSKATVCNDAMPAPVRLGSPQSCSMQASALRKAFTWLPVYCRRRPAGQGRSMW